MQRQLSTAGIAFAEKATTVQHAFVDLAFRRLRLSHAATPDEIERTMRVLDSGRLDALMDDMVPMSEPAAPERYADVKPFDHEAWKARHASK